MVPKSKPLRPTNNYEIAETTRPIESWELGICLIEHEDIPNGLQKGIEYKLDCSPPPIGIDNDLVLTDRVQRKFRSI